MTDRSYIKGREGYLLTSVQSVDPDMRRMALEGENNHVKLLEDLQRNAPAEVKDMPMYLESVIWILVILPRSSSHRYKRCSPTVFQGEEEGHLEKRIKARVIQSSSSDWASALVLVRKKDGSVQWCVDYWALNTVTVKDTYLLPLIEH